MPREFRFPDAGDTSLGGAQGRFPDTSWGFVARVRADSLEERRKALESLCSRYWKPIYRYVRIAWAKTNEDAKDLTQAFLLWLAEGDPLRRYDPARGGFRNYLKLILKRFVGHQQETLQRLKRGGGARFVDLAEIEPHVADGASDPEEIFDRDWTRTLLKHAVERVRQRLVSSGRELQFRVFEAYDIEPGASYAEVAARLGIKEGDVRNWLFAVREELRAEIRSEIAQTISDENELEEEWRVLFGS